jgi:hypothetical protein
MGIYLIISLMGNFRLDLLRFVAFRDVLSVKIHISFVIIIVGTRG